MRFCASWSDQFGHPFNCLHGGTASAGMSFPDVVNSSGNPSSQRPVNVTQRSQVSSAVLIENEAGIKKGHVNSIASLFGQQQTQASPVAKPPSRSRASIRSSIKPVPSAAKTSRIPAAPKETRVYQSQTQASQSSARSNPAESAVSSGQPVPWPKPSGSELKPVKSFGKSDSDLYASSAGIDSRDARHPKDSTQPTIVFNKTRHVPRETRSSDRDGRQVERTKIPSAEPPGGVRVGRWTVYETLPFKDGSGLNRGREESKQREREAQQKREEEEWRRREATERERMADAERRKEEYDRKHREEMKAQERLRREELEREREESRHRAEEERLRRKELEKQERRRKEEAEREMELEHERQENEMRLREAREKRRIEMEQEEEDRRLEAERQRREKREREYQRRMQLEDHDRLRLEEKLREEETRRRIKKERQMRDSTQDVYTAEEWTVYEKVPLSSSENPHLNAARTWTSESSPYFQGSSSTVGYRRFLGDDIYQKGVSNVEQGDESEYMRNLRQIEENRRRQEEESEEEAMRLSRDAERQDTHYRQEKRRGDDGKRSSDDAARFREGMNQWSALTEAEPIASGSAVGYRRFLGHDVSSDGNHGDSSERQRDDDDGARREAEEARRRREADERNRREAEGERRRQEQLEMERRRRLEVDSMRREEERKRKQAEEERRHSDFEEDNRRRREEEEERRHERDGQLNINRGKLSGGNKHLDLFSRDEWTEFESVPVSEASVRQSALRRNPSQESIVGYRRLLEDSTQSPDDTSNSRSHSYEKKTRTRVRIGDEDSVGRKRRTEMLTQSTRHGKSEAPPPKSQPDEDARFEEWTEFHTVPAQFNVPDQSSTTRYGGRESSRRRHTSHGSDDGERAQPTFEEWTVVHKVPEPLSQSAATAYDVTDASNTKASGRGSTSKRQPRDHPKDDRPRHCRADENHAMSGDRGRDRGNMRQTRSTADPMSMSSDSDEELSVEEIMPRRQHDTAERQRDALLAAALRQLDASVDESRYDYSSSSRPEIRPRDGDGQAAVEEDSGSVGVTGGQAHRLSPYHSYQRMHGGRQGRPSQGVSPVQSSADNGNVFHDRFNVSRENPAYYFHH